jgi:hypothetical protein
MFQPNISLRPDFTTTFRFFFFFFCGGADCFGRFAAVMLTLSETVGD